MQKASSHPVHSEVGAGRVGQCVGKVEAALSICRMDQDIPNPKLQIPNGSQIPNFKFVVSKSDATD